MAGPAGPRATRAGSRVRVREQQAEAKARFIEALAKVASVTKAAKLARIGRMTVYDWLKADEDFAKAFGDAVELGTDALEDEAVRRANEGYLKPVFQQGKKVGTVREFSDRMLEILLKARRPDKFKDRQEVTGKDGAPLNVNVYLPAKGGQGEATAVEGPAEPEEPAEPEPAAAQAEPKKPGRKRSNS